MNEKQTRKQLIDQRLKEASWNVNDLSNVIEEHHITADAEFVDYVLRGKDGKPIAVVEAKRSQKDARIGEEQARQYAYNVQSQFNCDLPFCFYTNGYDIYFWDLGFAPPRKIYGFPKREDLERLRFLRLNQTPLTQELINTRIAGRPYQIQAIRSVLEGIERGKRKFLLVMATGTGKTRTTIALIDTLMRANRASRILFLVDRIELRNQAINAFKTHSPSTTCFPNSDTDELDNNRRVYVFTYPSLLNLIKSKDNPFSAHFFDFVVIDESHRSIYNVYGDILTYFDAIQLGLTATPTDVIDHNTFKLFECEEGLPDYAYDYDKAVKEGYLSDFDVLKFRTQFQIRGINRDTISLEEQKRLILEGQNIDDISYEGADLERIVTNIGTNTLIVREFMENAIKDPNGVLTGKTIFFCVNIAHARSMKDIFDCLYPEYKGEIAKVIVSDDPRVYGDNGLLAQFRNNDMPRIGISVGMLDTGIDILEIVNLVFAKPIFSYTRFWQMIGRGTRLLDIEKLKSWCPDKDRFLIMDCWENVDYFKLKPKGREPKAQIPLPVRLFRIRLEKLEWALQYKHTDIIYSETQLLRGMLNLLPQNSIIVLDNAKDLEVVKNDGFWSNLNESNLSFLKIQIAPILRVVSDVDFSEMLFQKDVVEYSLAKLKTDDKNAAILRGELIDAIELEKDEKKRVALREGLIEEIGQLQMTVHLVAQKSDLIRKAKMEYFWNMADNVTLDNLTEQLAPLMEYRQKTTKNFVTLNIRDAIEKKEMVEFGAHHEMVTISRYKEMLAQKIAELEANNEIVKRIKQGETITEEDVKQLAILLEKQSPHVTEKILQKVFDNRKAKFIHFIRHLLGLTELQPFTDVVNQNFDRFVSQHNDFTTTQLQFLDILRGYIIERGSISKKDLIQAPFTHIHKDGILGIFTPRQIEEVVQFAEGLAA
jgi:type I restriction enzyme R subunit